MTKNVKNEILAPFSTLSNAQLIGLTDEQIKKYLDYICAEEGVPLEVVEPEAPEAITQELDLNLMSFSSFIVSEEVGKQITELLANVPIYTKRYNENYYRVANSEYDRQPPQFIKGASEVLAAQEAQKNYAAMKLQEEYEKQRELFKEAVEKRQEVIERVYDQISSARAIVHNHERKVKEWERYLELAANDRDVAKKFFVDRYSLADFDALFDEAA